MKITDGNYVDEKDAEMAYTYDNTETEYIKCVHIIKQSPDCGKVQCGGQAILR